jgi:hypothetical protein
MSTRRTQRAAAIGLVPILAGFLISAAIAGPAEPKCVHVFVALADNAHQGIVKVPDALGNGDDPAGNLYWGAMYGVKTFFQKSAAWEPIAVDSPLPAGVLERRAFRHAKTGALLLADAYKGSEIKRAVVDFLSAAGGGRAGRLDAAGRTARIRGGADLVVYVGHNGLMDFSLEDGAVQGTGTGRDAIVLACKSKPYFGPWLQRLNANPVLLTTGFMAPEAYTLHDALESWIAGAPPATVREKAAAAYHQYQKCGLNGARRLFDAGGR